MQSANWVSAENGLCVVQTTEINEFGTGSTYNTGGFDYFLQPHPFFAILAGFFAALTGFFAVLFAAAMGSLL
jgi:hypothetical protein